MLTLDSKGLVTDLAPSDFERHDEDGYLGLVLGDYEITIEDLWPPTKNVAVYKRTGTGTMVLVENKDRAEGQASALALARIHINRLIMSGEITVN